MLNSVLNTKLREKAGAESYNRFEYQTGWIVFHVLKKFEQKIDDFLILCEFHDDVAEASNSESPDCLHFYQVKTKKSGQFTLRDLTHCKQLKNGIKHSFLGFIFHNYLTFQSECERCTFVTNCEFDDDLNTWQAAVQDGKVLKDLAPAIFLKLRNLLRNEYPNPTVDEATFDQVFQRFCQNTFLQLAEIGLDDYSWAIKGKFLEVVAKRLDIKASTAHQALEDIWNVVRQKAKKVVSTPISLNALITEKGITGAVFNDLRQAFDRPDHGTMEAQLLRRFPDKPTTVARLVQEFEKHRVRRLNMQDSFYLDLLERFYRQVIERIFDEYLMDLDNASLIEELLSLRLQTFSTNGELSDAQVSKNHLRAVFYAELLSRKN